jgi:hypothetical protein
LGFLRLKLTPNYCLLKASVARLCLDCAYPYLETYNLFITFKECESVIRIFTITIYRNLLSDYDKKGWACLLEKSIRVLAFELLASVLFVTCS